MSLINDALRRAKQAQQDAPPPPPGTQFRPVDPKTQSARHGVGLLLPALLAATGLLALLLFWELSRSNPPLVARTPLVVSARTPPSVPVSDAVLEPAPVAEVSAQKSPIGSGTQSVTVALGSANTNLVSAVSDPADTNRTTAPEPAAPALPALKLQGIVYNPRRPSALINGRVTFLGDRVREYRVLAIRRDEVMLVGAGQTNVLSLEP